MSLVNLEYAKGWSATESGTIIHDEIQKLV
jgi:hypothetical protein